MNTKLLASIAILALVTSVVASSTLSAYAADPMMDKKMKMDAKVKVAEKVKTTAKPATAAKPATPATPATASAKASNAVTVEMAKGTASNTKCAEKCFVPNVVTVTAGGKVTWKNVDSAGHFASASDGKTFDTGMVNAGSSTSATFKTAGSYDYLCMVHPWMKGTVKVQ